MEPISAEPATTAQPATATEPTATVQEWPANSEYLPDVTSLNIGTTIWVLIGAVWVVATVSRRVSRRNGVVWFKNKKDGKEDSTGEKNRIRLFVQTADMPDSEDETDLDTPTADPYDPHFFPRTPPQEP
mmetsp:Transcript_5334/g.9489  ORF Transcript_5334/g.9489 Transcript_5334/m.9489 type:complete len:129 (-) Transcript_5334:116-502(-)